MHGIHDQTKWSYAIPNAVSNGTIQHSGKEETRMAVSQTEKEMRWVINDKEDTVADTISELKAEHPEKTFVVGDPQETRMFRLDVMKRIGLVGIYELTQKQ